jgi:hypothetical protein
VGHLRGPRLTRRDVRRLRGARVQAEAVAHLCERAANLLRALREVLDHLLGHAENVCDPVLDIAPLHAQVGCQAVAQVRLVQVAGRLRVGVDQPRVQRAPAAVAPLAHVRDQDVGVEMRVVRPRRPLAERRGHEAAGLHLDRAVVPAAAPRRRRLQVGEGLANRLVVGVLHHPVQRSGAHLNPVAERPQQADALRRLEARVDARHPLAGTGVRRAPSAGIARSCARTTAGSRAKRAALAVQPEVRVRLLERGRPALCSGALNDSHMRLSFDIIEGRAAVKPTSVGTFPQGSNDLPSNRPDGSPRVRLNSNCGAGAAERI